MFSFYFLDQFSKEEILHFNIICSNVYRKKREQTVTDENIIVDRN